MSDTRDLVQKIADGEAYEGGAAIRALACKVVRLETMLRQVHPGLFADDAGGDGDTKPADVNWNSAWVLALFIPALLQASGIT